MKNTYYVRYGSFSNVYGLLAVTDEIDQSIVMKAKYKLSGCHSMIASHYSESVVEV